MKINLCINTEVKNPKIKDNMLKITENRLTTEGDNMNNFRLINSNKRRWWTVILYCQSA